MAANRRRSSGRRLNLTCTDPATPASGDPCRVGRITGVALTDEGADDISGKTTIDTQGVYALSVKGVNDGGNSAVAVGDSLYYVDADTPKVSKKVTGGFHIGFALETVGSGATATIMVKLSGGTAA